MLQHLLRLGCSWTAALFPWLIIQHMGPKLQLCQAGTHSFPVTN